mmetsp:Transcript_24200/g.54899  ORF Transcript_24200/g.54899 Transcript_24200/m.54899 type:complete len:255 (+) Transcript_24200:772-1536(+)
MSCPSRARSGSPSSLGWFSNAVSRAPLALPFPSMSGTFSALHANVVRQLIAASPTSIEPGWAMMLSRTASTTWLGTVWTTSLEASTDRSSRTAHPSTCTLAKDTFLFMTSNIIDIPSLPLMIFFATVSNDRAFSAHMASVETLPFSIWTRQQLSTLSAPPLSTTALRSPSLMQRCQTRPQPSSVTSALASLKRVRVSIMVPIAPSTMAILLLKSRLIRACIRSLLRQKNANSSLCSPRLLSARALQTYSIISLS